MVDNILVVLGILLIAYYFAEKAECQYITFHFSGKNKIILLILGIFSISMAFLLPFWQSTIDMSEIDQKSEPEIFENVELVHINESRSMQKNESEAVLETKLPQNPEPELIQEPGPDQKIEYEIIQNPEITSTEEIEKESATTPTEEGSKENTEELLSPRITITYPVEGSDFPLVNLSIVEGKIDNIPEDRYLWIILHNPNNNLYYPFSDEPAIDNGKWNTTSYGIGSEDADGYPFYIGAYLLDENSYQKVKEYVNRHTWEGMASLPGISTKYAEVKITGRL